jgi:hypothetical protein
MSKPEYAPKHSTQGGDRVQDSHRGGDRDVRAGVDGGSPERENVQVELPGVLHAGADGVLDEQIAAALDVVSRARLEGEWWRPNGCPEC